MFIFFVDSNSFQEAKNNTGIKVLSIASHNPVCAASSRSWSSS